MRGLTRTGENLAFAAACAGALALSAAFVPMSLAPDSGDYLSAAQDIQRALHDKTLSILDIGTKFRILGYPALLAALEQIAEGRLNLALHLVQGGFVLLSGTVLFAMLRRLGVSLLWAALLAGLYVTAWPRHLAGFVLVDAIHNALTAITVCLLVEPLFREVPASWGRVAVAGLLLALAFLLRESDRYLAVCYLPILLALVWKQERAVRGLLQIAVFAAPLLLTIEAYKGFNGARFGERFVTTGGRTAMLQPLMPVAKRHADFFAGSTPLDARARTAFTEYDFAEILKFNSYWLARGVSEERLADWAFERYFAAWRRYPVEMVSGVLARLRFDKQATELLNPPGSVYISRRWRAPELPSVKQHLVAAWRGGDLIGLLGAVSIRAGRVPSILIYLVFLIGAPVAAVMAWRRGEVRLAFGLGALPATYIGYCLVFSLIHLEMRYLGGVAVLPVIGTSLTVLSIRRYRGKPVSGAG